MPVIKQIDRLGPNGRDTDFEDVIGMKAAVMYQPNEPLVVEEISLEAPRDGEVLVKLAASGLCGSDIHLIMGELRTPVPIVLGHEGAGIVEGVGPGVTYVKPGDHVVLTTHPACGECPDCRNGHSVLCPMLRPPQGLLADGTTRMRKGDQEIYTFSANSTFGEKTVVPESTVVRIRDDAPLDKMCLIGCGVTTGVGAALNTAKVKPGSRVVVVGTGGVGLSVVQGAVLAGADVIIGVDVVDSKLEYARQLGATHVVNSSKEDPIRRVKEITNGEMADYAFEAISTVETIAQAFHTTRNGGVTVVIGIMPAGSRLTIDANELRSTERVLMGCAFGTTDSRVDMPKFVDMYMDGRLKLDEMITRSYRLEEINTALEHLMNGELARGIIKYD